MPKSPPRSKALLDIMTDSTALPALVPRLEPGELGRLIDDVGLADAGALVVHANARQIAHLVDESVWRSVDSSGPESFDVAELMRWFDLWLDIGSGFAAEKLIDLGADFCALAFAKLLIVDGSGAALETELTVVVGTYLVSARFADEWDSTRQVVLDLWDEDPDFTEAVLGRLSFRHSILAVEGEEDTEQVLEADAAGEHAGRKAARGFVLENAAAAYLEQITTTDLEQLAAEREYDLATAASFKDQERFGADGDPAMDSEEDDDARAARQPADAGADPAADAELDALERELEHYESQRAEQRELLAGPPTGEQPMTLRRVLADWPSGPDEFDARARELAHLSNLVIAGCRIEGEALDEAAAANLVLATCNLGGSYLVWLDGGEAAAEAEAFAGMLRSEPGLMRLFRIGWHLLSRIPAQVAVVLQRLFLSEGSLTRAALAPWLQEEITSLLTNPELLDVVRAGDFDDAQETVSLLVMALERSAVTALTWLVGSPPRFAVELEGEANRGSAVGWRYLASMRDLVTVDRFLNQLREHLNV